jgi:hypothetical protein
MNDPCAVDALHRARCAWPLRPAALLLAAIAPAASGTEPGAAADTPRHLRCEFPDGSSLGVIHRHGVPVALTGGAVAGARECATRSTQPAQPASGGGWRFDWHDAVLADTYRAELQALPGGGFTLTLAQPASAASAGPARPGRVRCGPLSLPAQSTLRPSAPGCRESEDRSQALQDAWRLLRLAVTGADEAAFRRVLAPEVELAEGAAQDSPRLPAAAVAGHLACVAALAHAGQRLADWAGARPDILVAPTGLVWQGDGEVRLGGYGGMSWQAGRWQLTWLNASRAVILRDC